MGKKRSKAVTPAGDVPIQYRPGPLLADVLGKLAGDWQVTLNQTARRLAALAAHGLDMRHHDLVVHYAERMYGQFDFVDACMRISIELQSADTTRCKLKQPCMTEDERQQEIEAVVRNYILMHRDPEEPTKEKVYERLYVEE